jgi:3-dehydroquinate synthase
MTTYYRSLTMLREIPRVEKADKVVLVTSAKLEGILDWAVKEIKQLALPGLEIIIIPDGEKAKNWNVLQKLLARFVKLGLTKKSVALAFGGGSVSDLVGFACANYKGKAVSYINIPTTLLAQVDASIGGKTAINFAGHKNLLRAFYDPVAIIRVEGFLLSLDRAQLIGGLAEIIKYGLISDSVILDMVECHTVAEFSKEEQALEWLIQRSVTSKGYFVSEDPEDAGIRQALNLGHTLGHPLEIKYGLSHGSAVLCGILLEFQALEQMGINISKAKVRFAQVLDCLGIKLDVRRFTINQQDLEQDKKISGKQIVLPVVTKVGRVRLMKVSLNKLMVAIRKCN